MRNHKSLFPGPAVTLEDTGESTDTQIPVLDQPLSSEPFVIHMLDAQLPYGCEFHGNDVSLALTPATERCFLTLTQVHHLSLYQSFQVQWATSVDPSV